MLRVLNIQSSPRGSRSASVRVADAFIAALRAPPADVEVDTLNVWEADLPEFDRGAIGAKYKGVSGEARTEHEANVWRAIEALAERFRRADRIVVGVPMWNFAYPYKLKQLVDLVSQRGLLFTFDGKAFGPKLATPRALVIYSRGQTYRDGTSLPPAAFDHQSPYIEFWLKFVGVREVVSLTVENTWSPSADAGVEAAAREAERMAETF